jgi:hypothetical protein
MTQKYFMTMQNNVLYWNFRTIYGGYRNRVGIGLSYRLAKPVFLNVYGAQGIDTKK